jgi:hypothetical protein
MKKILLQSGDKFGRLEYVRDIETRSPDGDLLREFHCQCGMVVNLSASAVKSGNTKSCGCLRREISISLGSNLGSLYRGKPSWNRKQPFEADYNRLVRDAARRKLYCSLTLEEFQRLISETVCHYCGASIVPPEPFGSEKGMNLDRKDNRLGYHFSNLVSACWPCNRGKCDLFTYKEWVVMTAALRQYRRKQ